MTVFKTGLLSYCRLFSKKYNILTAFAATVQAKKQPPLNTCWLSYNSTQHKQMANLSTKAILIDLSGTLHIDDTAIEEAPQALSRLRNSGVHVKFVTNTTKESMRLLHGKLKDVGFDINQSEIFTSLTAARALIEEKHVRPYFLLEECAKEDFEGITVTDPNAVVVGLAPSRFNYSDLNRAFRLLLNGASLIAIHKGRYYKKADGQLHLGPGPFVAGLEFATDTKAEVVGKPEERFFHSAIKDLGVEPRHTVMIGDDARDDIAGAIKAGMRGILVQTGKYRAGDENRFTPAPTAVCKDFPHAVDYLLQRIS